MEDTVAFYPAELPADIDDIITGAHTLDVRRMQKGNRIVHRVQLTIEGKAVAHGQRTDRATVDIASEIWAKASDDANNLPRQSCRYRITATYAAPARGTSAEPRSFEMQVGDSFEADERTQRQDFLSELRAERRELWTNHMTLMRETTRIAQTVGTIANGLAEAIGKLAERERELNESGLEREALRNANENDRQKMQMLQKTMAQVLAMMKARGVKLPGSGAEPAAPAESPAPTQTHRIVGIARTFGRSLSAAQKALARTRFGSSRLEDFAEVDAPEEVMQVCAWLYNQNQSDTLAVYDTLSQSQGELAAELQEWAVAESAKSGDVDDAE